jgi:hypothetical protein
VRAAVGSPVTRSSARSIRTALLVLSYAPVSTRAWDSPYDSTGLASPTVGG